MDNINKLKNVSVASRLREAMARAGLRQVDLMEKAAPLCDALGVSITKGLLSQYLHGHCEPGRSRIYILSQVLDVDPAWLMGLDVPMKKTAAAAAEGVSSATRDARLLDMFSRLTTAQQIQVLQYIDFLIASGSGG